MEGLDKIFESLDDKIFTNQLKLKLKQQFNEAVERKSDEVIDVRLEEELEKLNEQSNEYLEKLDEDREAKIEELSEKSNEHIELLNEKSNEHIELLNEKSNEHIELLNEKFKDHEEHIEMLNEKSNEHIELLNEKAEKFSKLKAKELSEALVDVRIEELDEKSEEHIDFLTEKAEEFVELQRKTMTETVGSYMDRVVEEFVSETKETLAESVKSSHADMLIEAFDSMVVAGGVKIADIVESRECTNESALEESNRKYDTLINENILLVEQNDALVKMGVISEVREGLSLVESDKFESLAKLVEFSKTSDYLEKLETIRESVTGAKAQESVPKVRPSRVSRVSRVPSTLNENVSGELICSHLL